MKKHKKVLTLDATNLKALCDLIKSGKIFQSIEKIYPSSRRSWNDFSTHCIKVWRK